MGRQAPGQCGALRAGPGLVPHEACPCARSASFCEWCLKPEKDQALILIKEPPAWAEEDPALLDTRQKILSAPQKGQTKGISGVRVA